jgi:hypothetical protein
MLDDAARSQYKSVVTDNVIMRRLHLSRAAQKKFHLHELAEHENEGIRDLVAWLNGSKGTEGYKRIGGLIQLIGEIRRGMPPVTFLEFMKKDMSADSGNQHVWEKIRRINEQLRDYPMCPRYTTLRTRGEGMKLSPLKWEWWPVGNLAAKAAYQVVRLEEDCLLELLRPCTDCKKWFFAAREWQKFCSKRCRDQHYSSSPEGRATRASYMRGYRKRERRMSEESMRVSRKKLTWK